MAVVGTMASLPNFEKFPVHKDESSTGVRWKTWIMKLDNLLCALDIKSDARKKALLLHYGGDDIFEIYDSMTDEQKGIGAMTQGDNPTPNEYEVLKKSFTDHFTPKQNTAYETFKFRQAKQHDGESIDCFYTRLQNLASLCDFHDTDKEILAQIIQGCNSTRVRRKALKDNMTLKAVLDEARALELSDSKTAEIEKVCDSFSSVSVNAVARRHHSGNRFTSRGGHGCGGSHRTGNSRGPENSRGHPSSSNPRSSKGPHGRGGVPPRGGQSSQLHRGSSHSGGSSTVSRCGYCGYGLPHYNSCPARGKECQKCFQIGHFARVCESSSQHKVRHLASKPAE